MKTKLKEYAFSVDVGDGEVAVIEAGNLEEAKKIFAEDHPEDVDKISCITSDDGYEEIN